MELTRLYSSFSSGSWKCSSTIASRVHAYRRDKYVSMNISLELGSCTFYPLQLISLGQERKKQIMVSDLASLAILAFFSRLEVRKPRNN